MSNALKFYIDGSWVDPATPKTLDVISPATEEPFAKISVGSAADVDRAVAAAKAAFPAFSQTTTRTLSFGFNYTFSHRTSNVPSADFNDQLVSLTGQLRF